MIRRHLFSISIAAIFLTAIMVVGCAIQKNPVSGTTRAFGYSWQQELQLGREADPQIVAQFGEYEDEALSDYLNEIGKRILEESHMRRPDTDDMFRETEFTFRMLDSPVINAFALPGGYIYFTRGMMAHLSNEAQFAVVMGHEIGHVAARHASQRALRQTLGQLAIVGGSVLGQEVLGLPGQTLMNLSSTAAQFLFLSYSRENERESDRLGVEYAARSGYDAAEGAALFTSLKRISARHGQSIPNFVSTHPDPGEREQRIPELSQEWAERGYGGTERNQERYMEIIDGLVFGENPRHGFVEEGAYFHPEMAFTFSLPENWNLINQPSQVVILAPDEEAISILVIDTEASSPRSSVQKITSSDQIELVDEQEAENSAGLNSWQAIADATLQDGTEVRLLISAIEYDGEIFRFLSYTHRPEFDRFESDFQVYPESFSELTDSEKLNVQPYRLSVFRADRSDAFESFLPDELPPGTEADDIAIINQLDPGDRVEEGTWLKIPRR